MAVWVALQVPGEVGGHTEAYTHICTRTAQPCDHE